MGACSSSAAVDFSHESDTNSNNGSSTVGQRNATTGNLEHRDEFAAERRRSQKPKPRAKEEEPDDLMAVAKQELDANRKKGEVDGNIFTNHEMITTHRAPRF
ncbi:MAG: hypothetical protein MHM6MM_004981 [Cercozoa sp. M6MM]